MGACIALTAWGIKEGNTNMDLLVYGIPAVFAELGLHTTWVVKKAERENIRKNKKPTKDLDIYDLEEI